MVAAVTSADVRNHVKAWASDVVHIVASSISTDVQHPRRRRGCRSTKLSVCNPFFIRQVRKSMVSAGMPAPALSGCGRSGYGGPEVVDGIEAAVVTTIDVHGGHRRHHTQEVVIAPAPTHRPMAKPLGRVMPTEALVCIDWSSGNHAGWPRRASAKTVPPKSLLKASMPRNAVAVAYRHGSAQGANGRSVVADHVRSVRPRRESRSRRRSRQFEPSWHRGRFRYTPVPDPGPPGRRSHHPPRTP